MHLPHFDRPRPSPQLHFQRVAGLAISLGLLSRQYADREYDPLFPKCGLLPICQKFGHGILVQSMDVKPKVRSKSPEFTARGGSVQLAEGKLLPESNRVTI
jgi:hypothetical protein